MKIKALVLTLALLLVTPMAHAVQVFNTSGAELGQTNKVKCTAGVTCTMNAGKVEVATNSVPFVRSCTITSAAAATAIHCLADADVDSAQKVYVTYWHMTVNGATDWATTATCTIQDTAGTPVVFETIARAAMTGNAFVQAATSGVTHSAAFLLGTGGTAAKGLDVKCNANGTGSSAVFTIAGFMK